ncbi:MAG TPA: PBP1A family penicillin-binding protein [Rhizomicrobium sp.]|jgi:penicillin-binding protein 1A|nr:PBP1A family penicillin-binding protein [Rhizomicrobium sp.]
MAGQDDPRNMISEYLQAVGDFFARHRRVLVPLFATLATALAVPLAILLSLPTILSWFASPLDLSKDLYAVNRPIAFTFLDADGTEIGHRGAIIGKRLTIDEMPPYLPAAFIAMEDRDFYEHHGFSVRGLVRAMWTNFRAGHTVQGGSTITQQTVKIVFLSQQRTMSRKMEELVDAAKLEKSLTKKQILELYLNRIYLGAGAYGVDGAAHVYFNKSARELTLPEAAMLATLTRAPSAFSPRRDLPKAQARAKIVLRTMVETGAITQGQADAANANPAVITAHAATDAQNYYFDTAADEAMRLATQGGEAPNEDLIVHTTMVPTIQNAARAAAQRVIAKSGPKVHASEAAVVVMKPDGAVVALVGGVDYDESTFNRATQAHRQPGSAFKPFVYLAALESGLTPWDQREDQPVDINGWTPTNFGGRSYGTITLADALAHSVNTITANLAQEVGVSNVVQAAQRLGIESKLTENASLALGTSEVTPLEITRAYAVIANGGNRVYPYFVTQIEDRAGHVLYQRTPPEAEERIVATHVDRDLVTMMNGVVLHGTGMSAALAGHDSAGKTGTTQDFHDAWFVGFTHDYVASVWVGNDDSSPMKNVTGGSLPAQIWKSTMTTAEKGLPSTPLDKSPIQPPADSGAIFGDSDSYTAPTGDDEAGTGTGTYYAGPGADRERDEDAPPPPPQAHRGGNNFWDWLFNRRGRDGQGRPDTQQQDGPQQPGDRPQRDDDDRGDDN